MRTLLATLLVTALASQAAAVPEPSTLLLSILGIAVFGMVRLVYQKVIMSAVLWESLILFSGRCGHLQINYRVLLALFWCTSTASILWIHSIACGQTQSFQLQEAAVEDINDAFDSGLLTSERLVQLYLNRIEAYDQQGPALNSIITLNPSSLDTARALDAERSLTGPRSPLHGIPILIKDNHDTFDMPTTAGSLSLATSIPPDDAFIVNRLREAGAIILGKANLAEFSGRFSSISSLGGQTHNPYDLLRTPGGSSGGTGASIASNLAAVGLGSDTGGSIRLPAAFNSLVGLRPTMGLVSRDGIVPISHLRDVAGPMTRTVADAAIILDTISGYDPEDPVTANSVGAIPESYTDSLQADGAQGARIGVLRSALENSNAQQSIVSAFNGAVSTLQTLGAITIELDYSPPRYQELAYSSVEYDLNNYFESLGPTRPIPPLGSVNDLLQNGEFDPDVEWSLAITPFGDLNGDISPVEDPAYQEIATRIEDRRNELLEIMDQEQLDAILYAPSNVLPPSGSFIKNNFWSLEYSTYGGVIDFAGSIGFPAITVPAGLTDGLPFGIELLGRPFSEPTLISLAYAYEQSTHHRQAPTSTPPLPGETILAADFDIDGDVDGADFLYWQINDGSESSLNLWQAAFGNVASSVAAASTGVPEPSPGLMLMLGVAVMLTGYNRS